MKHHLTIDDRTQTGKRLLEEVRTVAKQSKSVQFVDDEEADTVPFEEFAAALRKEVEKRFEEKS